MNIFFDFDGTLVDSKLRLYTLFVELFPEIELTFDQYWELKKKKISNKKIITQIYNFKEERYQIFEKEWMDKIEDTAFLNFDKLFEGTEAFLFEKSKEFKLHLVTHRQFPLQVIKQLNKLGIHSYFSEILVTEQKREKHELILEKVLVSKEDWIVGDTGIDILCGKKLGINTAAVLSGFLGLEQIKEYNPDLICNYVTDLKFYR